jgi:hypothetical protein
MVLEKVILDETSRDDVVLYGYRVYLKRFVIIKGIKWTLKCIDIGTTIKVERKNLEIFCVNCFAETMKKLWGLDVKRALRLRPASWNIGDHVVGVCYLEYIRTYEEIIPRQTGYNEDISMLFKEPKKAITSLKPIVNIRGEILTEKNNIKTHKKNHHSTLTITIPKSDYTKIKFKRSKQNNMSLKRWTVFFRVKRFTKIALIYYKMVVTSYVKFCLIILIRLMFLRNYSLKRDIDFV